MRPAPWKIVAVGTAILAGLLLAAVTGVAASPSEQADPLIPDPSKLTGAYVGEPVMPVDTKGLPLAAPPSAVPGEPQERAYPQPPDHAAQVVSGPPGDDPAVQRDPGTVKMPAPEVNFEGIPWTFVLPPDTDGQVGPEHYVQIVNSLAAGAHVRVWDKTGVMQADFGMGNLWPTADPCYQDAYGDPVVLYDQLADRWLLTQFALPAPYYECIAVSKDGIPTADPNDWYLYSFLVHGTKMNDYPKLGIWPDGYYMSANQFAPGWAGAGVWVFDREKMLNGEAATFQYFDIYDLNSNYGGLLPSNLMGSTLPPDGAPNYYAAVDMNWSGSDDVLHIFEFHTDWDDPSNSSFGLATDLVVDPFIWTFNGLGGPRGNWDIPQPITNVELDSLSDRLMMHLWYRNFGGHESLVVNHTVNVGTTNDHAGVRWYEIRGGTVNTTLADASIYQQGTYAPDSENRWMGSMAMDSAGNIAVGYSVSSSTVYPSIRYTGRLADDPLGTLPQSEEEIIAGSGYQSHSHARWGDYSAMSVDPVDDCTFWYTQEYIETSGLANWQTRIASFEFPGCGAPPDLAISKVASADPIEVGMPLVYTITVTNSGGRATGVTISDTVPNDTLFAWAADGGTHSAGQVTWSVPVIPNGGSLTTSFAVTVNCVSAGTQIVNDTYSVNALELESAVEGSPVTVTAMEDGVTADFYFATPVLRNEPTPFSNLSQNGSQFSWNFGDGTSSEKHPTHVYSGPTGDYTVSLTAQNLCNSDSTSQPLTLEDYAIAISPESASQSADPGGMVVYSLQLTNVGTLADTFEVTASGNGWTTQLSQTSLDLDPTEDATVDVEVTIPVDAGGDEEDSVVITARPQSDPRTPPFKALAELTTVSNYKYSLELEPPAAWQSGAPNAEVDYELIIRNTSNAVDTFTFERLWPGWPTTIVPSELAIARGGWRTIHVYVTVPGAEHIGEEDVATIRATGSGGYSDSVLTTSVPWFTYVPLITRLYP